MCSHTAEDRDASVSGFVLPHQVLEINGLHSKALFYFHTVALTLAALLSLVWAMLKVVWMVVAVLSPDWWEECAFLSGSVSGIATLS